MESRRGPGNYICMRRIEPGDSQEEAREKPGRSKEGSLKEVQTLLISGSFWFLMPGLLMIFFGAFDHGYIYIYLAPDYFLASPMLSIGSFLALGSILFLAASWLPPGY
jgi:hypothetical protein